MTEEAGPGWRAVRAHLNRCLVAVTILVALPVLVIAEWFRPGGGRVVALRTLEVIAHICGVKFVIAGAERLEPGCGYVFVPNHSSFIDIPAMLFARPDVRFLAAGELFRNRLFAFVMRALGTVAIDRKNSRVARSQLEALWSAKEPICITVFAEGRLAPLGERLPFKSGAFVLAITTGASVVPVAIRSGDMLPPGRALGVKPGTVTVEILEPIPTEGMSVRDRKVIRDQTRAAILRALDTGNIS